MNEKIGKKKEIPQELIHAKLLLDKNKLDDADQLIMNFEEKEGHILHDLVFCRLLKCELLFWRGLYGDVVKLAKHTYKESLGLGKNLFSVDILLIMADALVWHKQSDKLHNIIKQGEDLLKTITQELPADYKLREAYITYLKGWFYILTDEADQALKHFEYSLALREEIGAKREIAISLIGIAWVFTFLKLDYSRALKYSERGMIIAKESGNKWVIGYCFNNMAIIYYNKGDVNRGLSLSEQGLSNFKEINNEFMIALILGNMGRGYKQRGDLERAFKVIERMMTIAEKSDIKWLIGLVFNNMAILHIFKGDLDRGIKFYEQALAIFTDLNIKRWVANILNLMGEAYKQGGELDRALECSEQGLALYEGSGNLRRTALFQDYLIQILIERGDLERAQQFLHRYDKLNKQLKSKYINIKVLLNKALLLKTSSRARNRGKAEEILNQILEDKHTDYELTIKALINLCELLLTELHMTNDSEILEEINPLIARLLDIAEKTGSYSILCETYLLRAKLSLITFSIQKAKRFLTQAQQITERFGLILLAKKIAIEKGDLLKKLDLWEKLKESGAPMSDRLKLARLDEKIIGIGYNHSILTPKFTEEKVIISKETKICLVCRGEVLGFSYICKCGVNYCENCARALTNLENVCWACDTPIDYLKPVKQFKDREIVKVEEKAKKEIKNEKSN